MDAKVNLSNGGVAVVIYGTTGYVKEYESNPRVLFIDGKLHGADKLNELVPANTKVVVMAQGMGQWFNTWASSFCRQKSIPFLIRGSNQAVYELLKEWFNGDKEEKPTVEEVQDAFVKGKLNVLVQHIDFTKSNAENAKVLLRKANELNIKSTFGSLAQFVANKRRAQSGTAIPRSTKPKLDLFG